MRIAQLVLLIFMLLFVGNTFAISITYSGLACQNAVNVDDPTPTDTVVQSRFEVIEEIGGGVFRLMLSGGLPRFTNNNQNLCIDSDTALGFSGIPAIDGLPTRLDTIDAIAYFNGQDLIVTVNSINTDLSAGRNTFSGFTTSFVSPISNILIFEYSPQSSTFILKKMIHNRGLVHTSGSTNSITPFFETILPTFGNTANEKTKILTPLVRIEYRLE